ncbi:hypothetical protein [Bradyrhizobium canariense]|uniref:hypothetical protein n=1 Tax=Bradyrhizobium canariense TaxID=255045 RepID=UPI001B8A736C|nr:hypothetical protein [Bradyrhizobium canariense]MBR0955686.1 hypothetical protein [Bradyrhizobium canariense]
MTDTQELIQAVEAATRSRYNGDLLLHLFRGTMQTMSAVVRGQSHPTMEIKRFFNGLAAGYKFDVTVTGIEGVYGGEWLYDLGWHVQSEGFYRRQVLVLESEMTLGRIAQSDQVNGDFHKLVQARADIHVWAAALATSELLARHLENCKRQIDAFAQGTPGDYYLFILFDWSTGRTAVEGYRRPS